MLGHDPTSAYLLVMDSTTVIKRYSGIAGTTITYVDSITLANAVDNTVGFFFDDTNNYYVCIDTTNNYIRRFNSSGTLVDNTSYTDSDSTLRGICLIGERYYLMYMKETTTTTGRFYIDIVPVALVR